MCQPHSKNGKRSVQFAPALRGICVEVDLFRGPDGCWHFAFHHQSEIMLHKTREKIRAALNDYLGFNCITRSPEDIWPGM